MESIGAEEPLEASAFLDNKKEQKRISTNLKATLEFLKASALFANSTAIAE